MSVDKITPRSGDVHKSPPGLKEWGPETDDLDESYAREMFFGKSMEEVIPLFDRSVIDRAEELTYMPSACFKYYLFAYRNYLMLPSTLKSSMAPDAASCFFDLVQHKLTSDPKTMTPLMEDIFPTLRHLALHQADYDADRDIYGDFEEKLKQIEKMMDEVRLGRSKSSERRSVE